MDRLRAMFDVIEDVDRRLKEIENQPKIDLTPIENELEGQVDINLDAQLTAQQRAALGLLIEQRAHFYKGGKVAGMIMRDIKKRFLPNEKAEKCRFYMTPQRDFLEACGFVKGWQLSHRDRDSLERWYKETKEGQADYRKYGLDRMDEMERGAF
jgi:hypothetical protein